jgi:hypothetical protein
MITATYVISLESISVNMGDPADDANESGSSEWETTPKTSDVSEGSQRGHSTRRAGKPRTWGRATAYQVPQVRSCPCIPGNPGWAAERKEGKDPDRRSPCAVKAARTVTTGGMGRHSTAVRPVPTHWDAKRCRPLNRGRMGALDSERLHPSTPLFLMQLPTKDRRVFSDHRRRLNNR